MNDNSYCNVLDITVPNLSDVADHSDSNTFSNLIVTLLEAGNPLTLEDVATRFEEVGISSRARALVSLKKCRPSRDPVYRESDVYGLNPHSLELRFWVRRLGLDGPSPVQLSIVRDEPEGDVDAATPLTLQEIDAAFTGADLLSWSDQSLALTILDSHSNKMRGKDVLAFFDERECAHKFNPENPYFGRSNATVRFAGDGFLCIVDEDRNPVLVNRRSHDGSFTTVRVNRTIASTRDKVRKRLSEARRERKSREQVAMAKAMWEQQSIRAKAELAAKRRVIVRVFPEDHPKALVLLDVEKRRLEFYEEQDLQAGIDRISSYDVVVGESARQSLRALGEDPTRWELSELSPSQKSMKVNRSGRSLKITNGLVVQWTCGISTPFGDRNKMLSYLRDGHKTRLKRRMESDAKSLYALFQYGRLHGCVRVRWGFLDELIPAPWGDQEEACYYNIAKEAFETARRVEIVAGTAPGWADPWARGIVCTVVKAGPHEGLKLIDDQDREFGRYDIQSIRLWPPRE